MVKKLEDRCAACNKGTKCIVCKHCPEWVRRIEEKYYKPMTAEQKEKLKALQERQKSNSIA